MKIESVEVIPMRKDSIFEDETLQQFECISITTSYDEWKLHHDKYMKEYQKFQTTAPHPEFDEHCERFAKGQSAFMLAPVAKFDQSMYEVRTKSVENPDQLFMFADSGPLFSIEKIYLEDKEAGKTIERLYEESFTPKFGLWYPFKSVYKIRYGVKT